MTAAGARTVKADAPREPSGWAPLRNPAFRRLWTAQFVSNVGSWEEHERQHARLQGADREVLDAIDALLAPGEHRTAAVHLPAGSQRRLRAGRAGQSGSRRSISSASPGWW